MQDNKLQYLANLPEFHAEMCNNIGTCRKIFALFVLQFASVFFSRTRMKGTELEREREICYRKCSILIANVIMGNEQVAHTKLNVNESFCGR